MEIYRLEYQGIGPYNAPRGEFSISQNRLLDAMHVVHADDFDHPGVYDDILDEDGEVREETIQGELVLSGCPSIEALHAWFFPFFPGLMKLQFKIYRIKVREGCYTVGRSGKQVGFLPRGIISKEEVPTIF